MGNNSPKYNQLRAERFNAIRFRHWRVVSSAAPYLKEVLAYNYPAPITQTSTAELPVRQTIDTSSDSRVKKVAIGALDNAAIQEEQRLAQIRDTIDTEAQPAVNPGGDTHEFTLSA